MGRKGIARDDTVVVYGDKSNWWAAYALWVFTLFGHPDVRLLDGGRDLWLAEGRDTTSDVPSRPLPAIPSSNATTPDPRIPSRRARAPRPGPDRRAVPAEYTGERTHMPDYPRGGRPARRAHPHRGVRPVGQGRRRSGPFRSREELEKIDAFREPAPTTSSSTAGSASDPATPGSY